MKLNKEFPSISVQDWETKLLKELKVDHIAQKQWKISDQIVLNPAYFKDKKRKITVPNEQAKLNSWGIGEDFKVKNFEKNNKELLEALIAGLEYPGLKLSSIPKQKEWANLFKDIKLDYIKIHFDLNKEIKPLPFIRSLSAYLAKNYSKPKRINGVLSFAHSSKFNFKTIKLAQELLPGFKTICIDLNKKKSNPEALLSDGMVQLEAVIYDLVNNGLSISKIRDKIAIRTLSTKTFYVSLAQNRALKILVMNLLKSYKLKKDFDVPIIAQTDPKDYVKDPNTNNIIATIQTMAAVLSGVERMVVSAPNKTGKHTKFSRRVSRNIQHIMKMESNLEQVFDSAEGSYFLDELTNQLVETSWRLFVEKSK